MQESYGQEMNTDFYGVQSFEEGPYFLLPEKFFLRTHLKTEIVVPVIL